MADNTTPWWEQIGDAIGIPGVAGLGSLAARYAPSAIANSIKYLGGVGAGLAAAPATAGLVGAQVMAPTPANAGEVPFYNANGTPNQANPLVKAGVAGQANPPISAFGPPPAPGNPNSGFVAPAAAAPAAPAATPSPTAPVQPVQPVQPMPMSLAPPNPGPSATSPAPAPQPNNDLIGRFVNSLRNASVPQPTTQQPQGLIPKLANDVKTIGSLFGGVGSGGDQTNNPTILGSFF